MARRRKSKECLAETLFYAPWWVRDRHRGYHVNDISDLGQPCKHKNTPSINI